MLEWWCPSLAGELSMLECHRCCSPNEHAHTDANNNTGNKNHNAVCQNYRGKLQSSVDSIEKLIFYTHTHNLGMHFSLESHPNRKISSYGYRISFDENIEFYRPRNSIPISRSFWKNTTYGYRISFDVFIEFYRPRNSIPITISRHFPAAFAEFL